MLNHERTERMFQYMEQHMDPDFKDHILVDKMGDVIVTIGDALEKAKAENEELKARLSVTTH